MITQFRGNAVFKRLIRSLTPEQTKAVVKLFMVGWQLEAGRKRRCRYCHTAIADAALHSPQGGVYHIGCASASGQERLSRNQEKCNNGRSAGIE